MQPFSIAGVQMYTNAENNIEAMKQRVDLLMHLYPWVEMVVFSELAPFGPLPHHALPLPSEVEAEFQQIALKHKIWLLPGSLFEKADGKIYNTAPIINPQGEVVKRYRKIFPFTPYEEGIEPGNEFVTFDVPDVGRFGVLICYDMWFPETTRTLTAMGAEVILHPVLTHSIDREIELNMAKAAAAQFQTYIFDINGLGVGGNGQSCVVDPQGMTLFQAGTQECLIPIEIDLAQVRRQRQRGMMHRGQPLKSFRDSQINFDIYSPEKRDLAYLDSLGPLEKPQRPRNELRDDSVPREEPGFDVSSGLDHLR